MIVYVWILGKVFRFSVEGVMLKIMVNSIDVYLDGIGMDIVVIFFVGCGVCDKSRIV